MTKDEILNMPAGKDMDRLIAEKVMGWYVSPDGLVDPTHKPGDVFLGDVCSEYPFSKGIAEAWLVVKFLKSNFWSTEIICWDFSERWAVTCEYRTGHGEPRKTLYADAETPMLAICRAALLSINQ